MMKSSCFILTIITIFTLHANAGENKPSLPSISLDSCYAKARKQFPLIRQKGLIEKSKEYNVSNASKGYLPQFNINGQATYQSAVTAIPLTLHIQGMNLTIPTLPKDQFNIHGEIDQTLYDGGVIKTQQESYKANAEIQDQSTEVQLFALKDRINQLYFGALLITSQIKQHDLLEKDIQNSIEKMSASVDEGTALHSGLTELQGKLLQQQQNRIDLVNTRQAYLDMLSLFIDTPLDSNSVLETPRLLNLSDKIKRPELALYTSQQKNDDIQTKMLNASNRPKLQLFVQGGYALPGLNGFDINPALYSIGGIRLSWSIGGYYTLKNQRQLLVIDKQNIDVQKDVFLFNTQLTLRQQHSDVIKLQQMIQKDNAIIEKYTEVKNTSQSQLNDGIITVHEYITDLDAEEQAKQNLLIHQIQLLMDEYNYQTTSGNE